MTRVRTLAVTLLLAAAARADVYAPGWSTIHADPGNTDYSPVRGARDVKLAWQRAFEGIINVGPTSDPSGRVYLTTTSSDCRLHALDAWTGETVWCSAEVNQFAAVSSALLDRDGRILLADGEAMHAFDRDGNVLWETPIVGVPLRRSSRRRAGCSSSRTSASSTSCGGRPESTCCRRSS